MAMGSVSRDVQPHFERRPKRMLETERLPDHADRLYRAAYALCGTPHDAEDLVQETFERVLRRPRFIRRDGDLAYLLRALRNTWIGMRRAQASRARTVELREEVEWIVDHGADPGTTALEVRAAYRDGRNTVVAFVRNGHTCVLAGYVHFASTLPKLASWNGDGVIPF